MKIIEPMTSISENKNERFDTQAFRQALGHFATGVTVVTANTPSGKHVGITANSFNSVSMQPPLVLWSLARNTYSFSAFEQAEHFIVNLLAYDQIELSNHFARKSEGDMFAGLSYTMGISAVPMLSDCAAYFQCRKKYMYDGGDHLIFVGEVLEFADTDRTCLIFHKGQYTVTGEPLK